MRKLLTGLALAASVAVVASVFLPPKPAEAGPVFSVALASSDGGSSQTVALNKKSCYCLQAKYAQTCYQLGTQDAGASESASALAARMLAGLYGADCTKAPIIPQPQVAGLGNMWPMTCFDSAGRNALVVANVDGGPANTNLYVLEANPTNPNGCTTMGQSPF